MSEESKKSKIERSILNAINNKIALIKLNFRYGDTIPKYLIPREYKLKYEVSNLFRVELPNFWRMLYLVMTEENKIEIVTFIIDITDHKEYSKKFGYRKN